MRRLLLVALAGCAAQDAGDRPLDEGKGDVWGTDDRIERYQIETPALRDAATSSVAILHSWKLVHDAARDTWSVPDPVTLGDSIGLCEGERFIHQPSTAWCSGTLIAEDLVVTAGHCFDEWACDAFSIVFDFAYDKAPSDPMSVTRDIPSSNVYRCAEVLASEHAVDYSTHRGADYALIRLDRKVEGHAPAAVAWSDTTDNGQPAYVIGQPTGLPQKLATGKILDGRTNPDFLVHDADVFAGNSGGGLFDASGTLIGIHVHSSGERYVTGPDGGCNVIAVCGKNATCEAQPHAYRPSALAAKLTAAQRAALGIPAT